MLSLSLLGMAALATAQSSTVSLFFPDADPQSLVASIAGSDSTATTYVVACANSAAASELRAELTAYAAAATGGAAATTSFGAIATGDDSACSFPTPVTVIQGPSTVHYVLNYDVTAAALDCSLSGSSHAVCTESASGQGAVLSAAMASATGADKDVFSGIQASDDKVTTTITGDDAMSMYIPVVVTAGSATAKPVSATTTGAAVKGGSTGTPKTGTSTRSSTGTSTGKSSSSSVAAQGTNGAMAAGPVVGAGMLGAFGVALVGAML